MDAPGDGDEKGMHCGSDLHGSSDEALSNANLYLARKPIDFYTQKDLCNIVWL